MDANEWDAGAFILNGRPTIPAEISRVLERLRTNAGAIEAILVSVSGRGLLRSVTMSTEASQLGRSMNARIRSGNDAFKQHSSSAQELLDLPDHELLSSLSELILVNDLLAGPAQPQLTLLRPKLELGKVGAIALVVLVGQQAESLDHSELLYKLQLMVNTTANVDVANDILMTTTMTKLGVRQPSIDDKIVRDDNVDELLRLVLDTTDSEAIALYERSLDGRSLTMLRSTQSGSVSPAQLMVGLGDESVVAVAVEERRPVFKSPDLVGLSTKTSGPRRLESAWVPQSGEFLHELAVPVPSAPLGRLGPPYGVLSVCRLQERGQPHFGRYDLAVLRNLAVRLGFAMYVNASARTLSATVEALGQAQASDSAAGLGEATLLSRSDDEGIPADFTVEREQLSKLVQSAAVAVDATSATLRLLLPGDGKNRRRRQLGLVRFLAFPPQRLRDTDEVLPLAALAVNSWVARTGETCYLGNVRDRALYDRYPGLGAVRRTREGTASELCCPVYAGGQLVGTLNFESPVQDAFGTRLATARLMAEVVGTTLYSARRRIVDRVLSFTSDVHSSSHEILQALDRVERAALEAENTNLDQQVGFVDALAEEARTIEHLLELDRRPEQRLDFDSGAPGRTGAEVFEYVQRERLQFRALTIEGETLTHVVIDSQKVRTVITALSEVLSGVQMYLARGAKDRAKVSSETVRIDGRHMLVSTVRYPSASTIESNFVQTLFRVPLYTGTSGLSRPHLGSYTAGALMRSIGGDVFFRAVGSKRGEIVIMIPIQGEPQ